MFISDEGRIAGSINRAQLAAAYEAATDDEVKENLAAAGAEHGMYVEDGKLVDPSDVQPEPDEAEAEAEEDVEVSEVSGRPAQNDAKAAWVDWAVSQGADRDEADALTKAELIEFYGKE